LISDTNRIQYHLNKGRDTEETIDTFELESSLTSKRRVQTKECNVKTKT